MNNPATSGRSIKRNNFYNLAASSGELYPKRLNILYICIDQNITNMADKIHGSGEDPVIQQFEQCGYKKTQVGQNFAAIRRGRGISQEYIASKLGKSQQTVSNIEAMEEIPEELLDQLAKILNVSPDYIKNYDLERVITNNTQIIQEGGKGNFLTDRSSDNTQNTNSLDVIKFIVAENERLHIQSLNEKNAIIKELKAEIKLQKAEIKRLNADLRQSVAHNNKK